MSTKYSINTIYGHLVRQYLWTRRHSYMDIHLYIKDKTINTLRQGRLINDNTMWKERHSITIAPASLQIKENCYGQILKIGQTFYDNFVVKDCFLDSP